jgi:bifunctional non-homologous end joining protein LigD
VSFSLAVRRAKPGIRYSEHMTGDGRNIFEHACRMGLEGIVSKRLNSPYRSGKVKSWLKVTNPKAAAVLRVQEAV